MKPLILSHFDTVKGNDYTNYFSFEFFGYEVWV